MPTVKITPREIDRLIAEQVMGWTNLSVAGNRFGTTPEGKVHRIVPPYSTDMSAAWEVVEKLRLLGYRGGIDWARPDSEYECYFGASPIPISERQSFKEETAPRAICLAALKVIGVSVELGG